MIYDLNGNPLNACYSVDGNELDNAYDIEGTLIYSKEPPQPAQLKVMSYNVQWFTKINSQQTMQDLIISKYTPDIIGFQEVSKTSSFPTVGANMIANYSCRQLSSHYNYLGIASKIPFSSYSNADYQTQDTAGDGSERRAYQKCYITVDGRQIAWFNTHLCYANATPKHTQMAELFNLAKDEDYFIITGDFNSVCLSAEDADYIGMYKQFVDAGCNLVNCSPAAGFTKTSTPNTYAATLADLTYSTDSIIVSPNIDIDSVVFDDTKLSYLDGNPIDHIPLIATLSIN